MQESNTDILLNDWMNDLISLLIFIIASVVERQLVTCSAGYREITILARGAELNIVASSITKAIVQGRIIALVIFLKLESIDSKAKDF